MKPILFSEIYDFREAEFNDIPALFTDLRIDRDTLPEGTYAYNIRGGDETDFCTIEPYVTVNHTGTIITRQPIPMGEEDFVEIGDFGLMDDISYEDWLARQDEAA